MPQTLAQKLIAKAAGRASVEPDEIVTCRVDLAMMHDLQGPRRVGPMLDKLGAPIWDTDRLVVVSDHFAPAIDTDAAGILDFTRKWAKANGIRHFYDMQGISHVLLPERGHLRPGTFLVGGDSHTPTGGAVGAFAIGVGSTEICGVIVTGEIWVRVPRSIRVNWKGKIGHGVAGKDMILKQCAMLSMEACDYRVIEYRGDAIAALPMGERLTLCNMSPELGAKTSVIPPDPVTVDYLAERGVKVDDAPRWQSDADAGYEQTLDLDAGALEPQISAPGSPSHSAGAGSYQKVAIDQAYIGACTGAKLSDLHMAAEVVRGRRVAPGVRFLIAPASQQTTASAAADGTLAALTAAGAILLPTGCGACAGMGAGTLAAGEVCIASSARNYKGRMGDNTSQVYLGSAYSVAAAAVAGKIVDPRELLQ
ncbi:MAG: 3-isopropylmalate dehydratase large subunit [Betaproteobacteria bacterium]|nr:3-isopropylmalate dehydratase large subunit [Betaproteobacteria bacterium]